MKLILIDDDCLVVSALKMILESQPGFEVAASAFDGSEALSLYRKHRPDVLLMDIRMKGMDGLKASEQILKEFPDARILLLTTFSDDEYIIKALKLGAAGYLLKQDYENIIPAIHAAASGQSVFGDGIVSRIPGLIAKDEKPSFDYTAHGISERELDVIRLIAEGLNNREIASQLYLSEGTVRNYLSMILDKLGLRDRTQLAVFYLERR
ncbi:response regulator transcription factor [Ruminococcus sp. CLA-AA-H200]|uniref:Stage 0 sporulation protein A homolog n=1 Tax=Ruminococcus turbiniformis TaxID=2881258 RepID=A0ABS8FTE0_9FIRM|nr:response regulator transcription factor [Ruminococcus turbiniformis]MCC2253285.1 response regulator transcription factor [Ruminococcus turbiniformis]